MDFRKNIQKYHTARETRQAWPYFYNILCKMSVLCVLFVTTDAKVDSKKNSLEFTIFFWYDIIAFITQAFVCRKVPFNNLGCIYWKSYRLTGII